MRTVLESIGLAVAAGVVLFFALIIVGALLTRAAFDSIRNIEPGPLV